jgi:hypothetical protein
MAGGNMSDKYMYLVGAEDVQRAANTIENAAYIMRDTASHLDTTLLSFRAFLDDWLNRLEQAVAHMK